MQDSTKKFNISSLIIRLPLYIVVFCAILYIVNGLIGYRVFKSLFEGEYEKITQQFAYTALSYIDGDAIPYYEAGKPADEAWHETDRRLNVLTQTATLAYIYVTVPDQKFETRTYIYDTVHPEIINGKAYPLGQINSLKKYDADYISNLKQVMIEGKPYIRFAYNKTGGHVTTSIPVRDSNSRIVAILSIVKPMSEVQMLKNRYIRSTFVFSSILTPLFIIIYIIILYRSVTKPLVLVTNETENFARHKGELSGLLRNIKGKSEIATLARAVEKMSVDMHRYIDDLTHTTAEKERLSAELDVATQIQANMLPRLFPPYADHPEIELFASMEPAKEVGGDFYDFFMVDDDHFAIVVGDVSGKGVPAALFMVIAKTLIKNVCLQGKTPAQVFEEVNNQLCEGNDAGLFVTCWMGILTLSTGLMEFANAGHTSPVMHHNGTVEFLTVKPNLMLAGLPDTKYDNHSVTLKPKDRLFVYTDGVTEATNENNELYGEERLLASIKDKQNLSSKEILEEVRKEISNFEGNAPQFDDITMLELSLKELVAEKFQSKIFDATDENMQAVTDFIHSMLPQDCPLEIVNKLDLAVEEVYINIAHYAYKPEKGIVEISCNMAKNADTPVITISFKDRGVQFDPLAKEDPDITLSADDREIGGLGIFLTKQFMDNVSYSYIDGQNVLTMQKTLAL